MKIKEAKKILLRASKTHEKGRHNNTMNYG